MARIVYIFVCSLCALALSPTVWAARVSECERRLNSYSEEQILDRAGDALAVVDMPPILADHVNPLMGVLERVKVNHDDRNPMEELLSARDYATWVHSQRGEKFVFVNLYKGTTVPVFDGLVLDQDGMPLYNVSLKFTMQAVENPDYTLLLKNLVGRMVHDRESRLCKTPLSYYRATNNWEPEAQGLTYIRHFDRDVERGVELSHIFGLNNPASFHCGRELRKVVDMRKSGYTFNFVNDPDFLARVQKMVRSHGYGAFTLALVWDSEHVLEFGP